MSFRFNHELWAIAGVVGITERDLDEHPIFCSVAVGYELEPGFA